jgi:hypothetical protein
MLTTIKDTEKKTLGGIDLLTLEEAIEKSKKENFLLIHQSKVSNQAYGLLKPFNSHKEEGYYFIPVFINGDMVTI